MYLTVEIGEHVLLINCDYVADGLLAALLNVVIVDFVAVDILEIDGF